jgi:hypothetical protein
MNQLTLICIQIVHLLYLAFVVITPFTNNTQLLVIHSFTIPFMMIHWYLNDNTCALTVLEKTVRQQVTGSTDEKDCFTCRLINPIYDFKQNYNRFSQLIYALTIGLWMITIYKLYRKKATGEVSSYMDFFKK